MLAPPSLLHYNELYRLKTVSISGFPASLACSLILTLLLGGLQVGPQSAEWWLSLMSVNICRLSSCLAPPSCSSSFWRPSSGSPSSSCYSWLSGWGEIIMTNVTNVTMYVTWLGASSGTCHAASCSGSPSQFSPSSWSTPWPKSTWWVAIRIPVLRTLISLNICSLLVKEKL